MARTELRPAADQSVSGLGVGMGSQASSSSKSTSSITPEQLRTSRLRARYGLSPAAARTVADHAYGAADNSDTWISLGDAVAMAIDTAAKAYEARR